jgi:hypothetical protein
MLNINEEIKNKLDSLLDKDENLNSNSNNTKVLQRKDGLIERVNSQKVILTEDNKMLLND